MAEHNGRMFTVMMYLIGVLVSITIFIAIPAIANGIINNDKDSRARDTALAACDSALVDTLYKTQLDTQRQLETMRKEQQVVNEKLLTGLTRIETKLNG